MPDEIDYFAIPKWAMTQTPPPAIPEPDKMAELIAQAQAEFAAPQQRKGGRPKGSKNKVAKA